jgi:hypothetical protein
MKNKQKKKTFSFFLDWHSSIQDVEAETVEEAEQILQKDVLNNYSKYVPSEFEIHNNNDPVLREVDADGMYIAESFPILR